MSRPPQTLAEALLNLPTIDAPNYNNSFFGTTTAAAPAITTGAQQNGDAKEGSAHNRKDDSPSSSAPKIPSDDSDDVEEEENKGSAEDAPRMEPNSDGAPAKTPKRRLNYTLEFKNKVIMYAEKTNNCQAASKYQVPRQCIQRWRQIKPELEKLMSTTPHSTKKRRLGGGGRPLKNVELDEKLDIWLQEKIRERGTRITGKMIKEYALSISGNDEFKASNGWLQRFMCRHGLATPPAPKNAPATPPDSPPSSPEPELTGAAAEWAQVLSKADQDSTRKAINRKKKTKMTPEPSTSTAPRSTSAQRQIREGLVFSKEGGASSLGVVDLQPEDLEIINFLMAFQQGAGPAGQPRVEPEAQVEEAVDEKIEMQNQAAKKEGSEEAVPKQAAEQKKEKKVELPKEGAEPDVVGNTGNSSSSNPTSANDSDSSDE